MNICTGIQAIFLHLQPTPAQRWPNNTRICTCTHSARSPSRASHRPPPQPSPSHFLLPNESDRLPLVSAALIRPCQTLAMPPATRHLLPLHASHARGPMTGRKNPLARASPLSPRSRQMILERRPSDRPAVRQGLQ
jgi:hypothetical protein